MLDKLLKRDDVTKFLEQLKTNERYYKKNCQDVFNHNFFVSSELALYIFYDALLKYVIVLDDIYLFDEYLEQLEKLYKKIDNFEDIRKGINRLIGKMVSIKLSIKNISSDLEQKQIISFIYNKYILDGYFVHGFNTSYAEDLEDNGFIPGKYKNYYSDFKKLNEIFARYNAINIIQKDFDSKNIYFTDDFVTACYYSNYSPMFFYNFINNKDYFGKRIRQDAFLKDDYNTSIRQLKRFMNDSFFSESDKNFVNNLVKKQWDLLHREDKKISLLLIKRKHVRSYRSNLDDYLNDESDFDEVIDRMLSSKWGSVSYKDKIDREDIKVINLEGYYDHDESNLNDFSLDDEDEYYRYKEENIGKEFLNVYGKASILIILGSLFISFGVIVTILMVLRGM